MNWEVPGRLSGRLPDTLVALDRLSGTNTPATLQEVVAALRSLGVYRSKGAVRVYLNKLTEQRLVKMEKLLVNGCPCAYTLTDEGRRLAEKAEEI